MVTTGFAVASHVSSRLSRAGIVDSLLSVACVRALLHQPDHLLVFICSEHVLCPVDGSMALVTSGLLLPIVHCCILVLSLWHHIVILCAALK